MKLAAAFDLLVCPICRGGFTAPERTFHCPKGHTFDLARQGYLNLLGGPEPANADTAAMLSARERVHASGLFTPVAAEIARQVRGRPRVLEVGSGTAVYLRAALGTDPEHCGIALDVSKAAARLAARSDPRVGAIVADAWRPFPIRDHCLDAVICAFAPRNLPEFARVLRSDGRLVIVTPKPEHLVGLRAQHGLLSVPEGKADQVAGAAAEFFELHCSTSLAQSHQASEELVRDLIAMGPNAFHQLPERLDPATVMIAVNVQVFMPLPG